MSVFYLKLSSGEDIVATISYRTTTMLHVSKALVIKQSFDAETKTLYSGFYIWIPFKQYLESVSNLPISNVMLITPVEGTMLTEYNKYIDYVKNEMSEDEMEYNDDEDDDEEEQIVVPNPKTKTKRLLN